MNKYEKDLFNKIFELEREYFEKKAYLEGEKLQTLINDSLQEHSLKEYMKFSKDKWKQIALEMKVDEKDLQNPMKIIGE